MGYSVSYLVFVKILHNNSLYTFNLNVYRLIVNGHKRDLTREDLWEIEEDESTKLLTIKLEKVWNEASKKYKKKK